MQSPKEFLGEIIWNGAPSAVMGTPHPESNEAVAERLRRLRKIKSGDNQTAFAALLGIETKRWNNFERGKPLPRDVAILLVKKFPDVSLRWIWLGIPDHLTVRLQRELAEAGKGTTAPSGRSRGKTG